MNRPVQTGAGPVDVLAVTYLEPLVPAVRWSGVSVLARNCGLAEYVNLQPYPEGSCSVEYVWSDGAARTIWYATKEEANDSLTSMGFIRPCPYVKAA